ncbi:hypothetical protein HID58_056981, partial [Brassica napus]
SGVALFRSGSFGRLELLEDDLSFCRVRPLLLLQTLRLVISVPAGASWASRWVGVLGFTIHVRFVLSIGLRFLCWFSKNFWLLVERWFCRSFPVPNGDTDLKILCSFQATAVDKKGASLKDPMSQVRSHRYHAYLATLVLNGLTSLSEKRHPVMAYSYMDVALWIFCSPCNYFSLLRSCDLI